MNIPWIPVCYNCLADAEVLERDNNGNPISWICPECGKIEYANENHNYVEDLSMIAKVEVRQRIAQYEQKIRKEKLFVEMELDRMRDACATVEMKAIWNQSKEYAVLMERWKMLNEVLMDVMDIRCDEMFDDEDIIPLF